MSLALLASGGCAPRKTMCTASFECGQASACVAGRCQVERATLKPAVDTARRVVVRPVDLAYVARGEPAHDGPLPAVIALGRRDARLLLRFALDLPAGANVTEAYVVLHRATSVDDDPAPFFLHGTRIVEAWEGGSVTYPFAPRLAQIRGARTAVLPAGAPLVRVDVLEMVRDWPRRSATDQGVAIVAEGDSITGSSFALGPDAVEPRSSFDVGPYLEVYVR